MSLTIRRLRINHNDQMLVDIGFEINRSLALVGESGSGKSLTIKALLGICDSNLDVSLEKESSFEWMPGQSVSFVPQNPFTALSPLTKIIRQMFVSREKGSQLFEMLGLDPSLLDRYPPELSGGQLQRVVVAMALSTGPKLLLLDEPTTALDSEAKSAMITLFKSLQEKMGFSLLFVTHDINAAESLCDDICVIRKGETVEYGAMKEIIATPSHPYTKALIEAEFTNRGFRI